MYRAKKPKFRSKDTTVETTGPMQDYEVHCGHCGNDFSVSMYPQYCVECGEELSGEREP